MQYYYNPKKKNTAAHIWVGNDTACRMLSTGGLKPGAKNIQNELDHRRVCQMCQTNAKKISQESNTVLDSHELNGDLHGQAGRDALLHHPDLFNCQD